MYLIVGLALLLSLVALVFFVRKWLKTNGPLEKYYGDPKFGALNAVLGIAVGYFGSHYDKEIIGATFRPYIPADWTGGTMWMPGTFTIGPVVFWPIALLAVWGVVKSLTAQAAATTKVNEEFRGAFDRLFTMPTKGFLQVYKEAALASSKVAATVPATIPVPKLEEIIRSQLDYICKVVKRYDDEGVEYVYGCNVMLYHGAATAEFRTNVARIRSSIKCIERGVSVENLSGVLELKPLLSIRSDTNRNADDRLSALALPIPEIPGPFDELNYVPGAPVTFASRNARVYQNQNELIGLMNANRRFSSIVLDDLRSTLDRQNDSIQGLICIPLYDYYAASPFLPIGILNIHKNRSDEFISKKFALLEPMLAPMVQNIEKLVSVYPG